MLQSLAALCAVLVGGGAGPATPSPAIRGDYVEARTNDVFTGTCFSNAEVFITGHQAVIAWKINQGSHKGVDLKGLTVAAAVRGSSTFGEDTPKLAKSVILVDESASVEQRAALVDLAKTLMGDRLRDVVEIKPCRMVLTLEAHEMASGESLSDKTKAKDKAHSGHAMSKAPRAYFWAPGLAEILTRPLNENDHFCGNETIAYAPLSKGADVLPAFTQTHSFKGTGLNTNWEAPHARSSFVGHFAF